MKNKFIIIVFIIFFTGCVTQPKEIVTDLVYVYNQCPIFDHKLTFEGKKYMNVETYNSDIVIVELDHLLYVLNKNKMIIKEFNNEISRINKTKVVKGQPITDNFRRIEKKIFVSRKCPTFNHKPMFEVSKFNPNKKYPTNVEYVIIELDHFLYGLEKNKTIRNTYNEKVSKINSIIN